MKYYSLLNFTKEPFSNSPDPEMFFRSTQHQGCLQKLELAIHLQRGLSVVIGDIGTGKSTICRQFIRQIHNDKILTYLILDPEFNSADEFLQTIAKLFSLNDTENNSNWQIKDQIKDYLFEQAAKLEKIPVLIIDEGQKLPEFCIEILRELLNFETNQHKLLQIIIFAQDEFNEILSKKANFADRITYRHHLTPLNFKDTREMIKFRLLKAHRNSDKPPKLFPLPTMLMIYLISGGYPRKIVMLCSKLIIALLVKNKQRAGLLEIISCLKETGNFASGKIIKLSAMALFLGAVIALTANYALNKPPTVIAQKPLVSKKIKPQKINKILPKPTPPKPPEAKLPIIDSNLLPEIIGQLPVEPGTTLSKMVARVYGRYTRARLKMVLKANKNLGSVAKLHPGTIIKFPKSPKNNFIPAPNDYWLQITNSDNLSDAYKIIKNYPDNAPAIIIVPAISLIPPNNKKMIFMIVVEKRFKTIDKARQSLKLLPADLQNKAIIVKPASRLNSEKS